jgi:biotin carboxyl carrier protein
MLWQVRTNTKTYQIELPDQLGDDRPFPVKIGNGSYIGRWHRKSRALHLSKAGAESLNTVLKTRTIQIEKNPDESETGLTIEYQGGEVQGVCRFQAFVDVYTPASTAGGGEAKAKIKSMRSPMNGKILAINNKVGDQVEQGAVLMVIEAMKMENKIFAPRAGAIKVIKVEAGQNVSVGQVLLVIA